ncbi:MAG: ATP-binding protein [Acidobacteriota bacterium]
MLGVISNIQDHKQTEEALRVSEAWFRLAQQAAQAGAWEWDLFTNQMEWSAECFAVFGVSPEMFRPSYENWLNLIHPDDRTRATREIKEAIQSNKPLNLEYRVLGFDGNLRWISSVGHGINGAQQNRMRVLGLATDVTARRQIEAALRQIEQLNQTVLDSMHEHIAVLDQNGNIVAVNRAWNNFARDNEEISYEPYERTGVGANYLNVCDRVSEKNANEAALVCAGIKDVLSGLLDHFTLECPCHSPTQERWFLLQVSPLPRERGGAVVTYLDITDRKQSEAERQRLLNEAQIARETAEAANRAKDEFIAQITHDLRSPLNAILGWATVLRSQSVDEKIAADALITIQQSAEKQKRLIEDLLEVSRMVSGNLRLDVRPVSLSAVIHSAMEIMRPACEAKEIDCETELATDADAITGDAARLEQVIWNLVSNAVKFTPRSGKVKVRIERADPYVQITVSDTGKGIQPAHLPRLFDRYWQSDDSDKRRSGGLGLGLSFVRHIVELHGGTVRAESEGEGKGAKFIISLPYRAVRLQDGGETRTVAPRPVMTTPAEEENDNTILSPSTLNGLLAVIVDDEQDARELVAAILRQYGAHVLIAATAAEALHLIRDSVPRPDLLISDISMPEEDGYSLIRKVRALQPDKGGQIPAIALTAYGRMEDRIRVLSAGFQRHVPKPVEPAELALSAAHLTGREIQHLDF